MAGSLSMVTTEVSSAKVAVVDPGEVGRSAVYSKYNNWKVLGPANSIKVFRGFPWP
jgi:hypothetical protein